MARTGEPFSDIDPLACSNFRKNALSYGLIGAFAFRIVATLLAIYLIRLAWVKLFGGVYLLYLSYAHFAGS